ncbi:hypothetical protein BH11ARM1_BH11ARM1_08990 [soil metagenome]
MSAEIKIIRAIPGATSLVPILRDFCRNEGTVTAFNDSLLFVIKPLVDEDLPVQVAPFGSVVREYLELCGEPAALLAPSGHTLAAIGQAGQSLPEDSPFARSAHFAGTQEALGRAIDDLADWGVTTELMPTLELSDRLKSKVNSLTKIGNEVRTLMSTLGRQSLADMLETCLKTVPERDGSLTRLLIFGGAEVPMLKQRWLKWAVQHGTDVTLVLDRHAVDVPLFRDADTVVKNLGGREVEMGAGNFLVNNLFAQEEQGGPPIDIRIESASDVLAECEWALRRCLSHGGEGSSAIYVRNMESYAPLLEAAALRLGLKLQMFRRAPLLTNAFARLTLQVLEFCSSDDVRQLIPIVRSSYLGLDLPSKSELLSAIRSSYRMRGRQWPDLESFGNAHKDRFPWLEFVLSWRQSAMRGPVDAREWMTLLQELLRADEVLPWSTNAQNQLSDMRERDLRARNRMERLLNDTMSVRNVAGTQTWNLRELTNVCRSLWSHAEVTIPGGEGVVVTSDTANLTSSDYLQVLGMLEGVFPRRRTESPILTDDELAELSQATGITLPNSHDRSRTERDEFYRVCAAAKREVVFSYPSTNDDRDNIPAYYLTEIERIGDALNKRDPGVMRFSKGAHKRTELTPAAEDCTALADNKLREAIDGPRRDALSNELVTDQARLVVTPTPDADFSPRELRDALECPFRYVSRNQLKLKPRRAAAGWNGLQRLPLAADLATQQSAEAATSALQSALETHLEDHYGDLPTWEAQILKSGGNRLIESWVKREFRARGKWPLEDIKRHAPFDDKTLRSNVAKDVNLRGSIPAVGQMGPYRVGRLYSMSAPEKSTLTEPELLFYGLHIMALHDYKSELALEIESMGERRVLLVLGRSGTLSADSQAGLQIIDLTGDPDTISSQKNFYKSVKALLQKSIQSIRNGSIEARPGDICTWCEYGELCRRSMKFSDEPSPFDGFRGDR